MTTLIHPITFTVHSYEGLEALIEALDQYVANQAAHVADLEGETDPASVRARNALDMVTAHLERLNATRLHLLEAAETAQLAQIERRQVKK